MARDRAAKVALTIAGSDPSGGAGLQMDLKCFAAAGVYGLSAVSAVTVQNSSGVLSANPVAPSLVRRQLDALYDDFRIDAVKTGMLHDAGIVRAVSGRLSREGTPLVVDPVLSATAGAPLSRPDLVVAIKRHLLPLATLVTPNIPEAEALTGLRIAGLDSMRGACEALRGMGAGSVLLKGGHLPGAAATDMLCDGAVRLLIGRKLDRDVHGTGCMLSAFAAAFIALGRPVPEAAALAKRRVAGAIRLSFRPGEGRGIGDPLSALPRAHF